MATLDEIIKDVSIVDLININNVDHVEAFNSYLVCHGWPNWFYKRVINNFHCVTYPEYWELIIQKKMAGAWMKQILEKD
jgi:hypothetical protein